MFHPVGTPMERGWVGRLEGDEVVHLASQMLQHLFTGGGTARDHARYPLADVELLSPLPSPPSIRVFEATIPADAEHYKAYRMRNVAADGLPRGTVTVLD